MINAEANLGALHAGAASGAFDSDYLLFVPHIETV